jgi:hypothetical protein
MGEAVALVGVDPRFSVGYFGKLTRKIDPCSMLF